MQNWSVLYFRLWTIDDWMWFDHLTCQRTEMWKNYKPGNVWAQKLARGQVPPLICETVCTMANASIQTELWQLETVEIFIPRRSLFMTPAASVSLEIKRREKQDSLKLKILWNFNMKASQPSFVKKQTATRRPRNTAETSGRTFKAGIGYKTKAQVICTISYFWIRFLFAVSSANIHCVRWFKKVIHRSLQWTTLSRETFSLDLLFQWRHSQSFTTSHIFTQPPKMQLK